MRVKRGLVAKIENEHVCSVHTLDLSAGEIIKATGAVLANAVKTFEEDGVPRPAIKKMMIELVASVLASDSSLSEDEIELYL